MPTVMEEPCCHKLCHPEKERVANNIKSIPGCSMSLFIKWWLIKLLKLNQYTCSCVLPTYSYSLLLKFIRKIGITVLHTCLDQCTKCPTVYVEKF